MCTERDKITVTVEVKGTVFDKELIAALRRQIRTRRGKPGES